MTNEQKTIITLYIFTSALSAALFSYHEGHSILNASLVWGAVFFGLLAICKAIDDGAHL